MRRPSGSLVEGMGRRRKGKAELLRELPGGLGSTGKCCPQKWPTPHHPILSWQLRTQPERWHRRQPPWGSDLEPSPSLGSKGPSGCGLRSQAWPGSHSGKSADSQPGRRPVPGHVVSSHVSCSVTPVYFWSPSYRCCRQTFASLAIGGCLESADGAAKGRDGAETYLSRSVSLWSFFCLWLPPLPCASSFLVSVSVSFCLYHSRSLCLPPGQALLGHPA